MNSKQRQGLHLDNVSKYYGDVAAVDDVSLSIEPGTFLTLLGPSGSGKTTILMSIAGFVQPTHGSIFLNGGDITSYPAEKRNFGMVFQGYALFPNMTVGRNVAFPLKVRGVSQPDTETRVKRALDMVQMTHLTDRKPAELSGGQQQRVALARALVFEPDLLLLDEPLSALDRKLRVELQWELKALHERIGMTFIYVTHDQDEALSMSDEIVVLRAGKIVQQGPPATLYDRPNSRFVANFMGGSNFLSGEVVGTEGNALSFRSGGQILKQDLSDEHAARAGDKILVALAPEKIALSDTKSQDGGNAVEGVIEGFNYFGNSFHFRIKTNDVGALEVRVPTWTCQIKPHIGNSVWLSWSSDASTIVCDDEITAA